MPPEACCPVMCQNSDGPYVNVFEMATKLILNRLTVISLLHPHKSLAFHLREVFVPRVLVGAIGDVDVEVSSVVGHVVNGLEPQL